MVLLETLSPHERTLSHIEDRLALEFRNLARLENPVIVDRNNVVLDGNHRVHVFKKLGFRFMPVCRIDYFQQGTQLRYWYRLIGEVEEPHSLHSIIKEFHGDLQPVDGKDRLMHVMEEDGCCFGLQHGESFLCIRFPGELTSDAVRAYDLLERIQERVAERGMKIDYIPCRYVHEEDFGRHARPCEVVLWTPRITKKMVIEAAKAGKVFAPKSTRHLIPARPLNVNVPTSWLMEDIPLDKMNRRFVKYLKGMHIKRLGPGQVIHGRYYEEELFVFVEKKEGEKGSCQKKGR